MYNRLGEYMDAKNMYLYQNILQIVDKEKLHDIDVKLYAKKVFELAKSLFGIKKASMKFDDLENDVDGHSFQNEITINKKLVNVKKLHVLTDTIFHEMRHIKQYDFFQKTLDFSITPTMPMFFSDSTIFFLNTKITNVNSFDLYYTSLNERDARNSALTESKKLFDYINKNCKSQKAKSFMSILYKFIETTGQKEEKIYRKSLYNLDFDKNKLKRIVTKQINKILDETEKSILLDHIVYEKKFFDNFSTSFTQIKLSPLLLMYCDESIQKKLTVFCLRHIKVKHVANMYIYFNNNYYWKTTDKDMKMIFEIANHYKVSFDEIAEILNRFDKNYLLNLYTSWQGGKENTSSKNKKINDYGIEK